MIQDDNYIWRIKPSKSEAGDRISSLFLYIFMQYKYHAYSLTHITKTESADFSTLPVWRRGWDSNPRGLSSKLISSQPRYDRFDTSASARKRLIILLNEADPVNRYQKKAQGMFMKKFDQE